MGLCSLLMVSQVVAYDHSTLHHNKNDFGVENWSLIIKTHQKQIALQTSALASKASKSSSFSLNIDLLEHVLGSGEAVIINIPLPDGTFKAFKLIPSSVMNSELAVKYPSIKTFTGYQIDNPAHSGNFDITPQGFHGVFTFKNDKVFLDPIRRDNRLTYQSYFRKDAQPLTASALGKRLPPRKRAQLSQAESHTNKQYKVVNDEIITYRIAVATTGEYSTFHGGTKEKSLAAVVTMLNRVNEVYERDLAIKLELVAANDSIIFIDAGADPFKNTDEDIDVNVSIINKAIGASNYDIGHVVGTGGGGVAGLGVVCSEVKAEGLTGSDSPTNDAFHIDYVAHEIGHQFGAEHTFNGAQGGCDGNRESSSAFEPGSASTIMGYAGICDNQNLQNNSDPYFHIHSIEQISEYTRKSTGNTCGAKQVKNNTAPKVNAGNDYTIPARTPFVLKGEASDKENDNLTYSWEQYDLGTESTSKADDNTDDGKRPLFRVFSPKAQSNRTLPAIADILSNRQTYGELLPTTSREMNFRLVVRDNKGNVANDAMKVTVIGATQGFSITEPSLNSVWRGSKHTITWHTASTEQAPVSCPTVDILLSTDSGINFSQVLASNVANDGSQDVDLPSLTTEKARIKLVCNNNIFFAINTGDININTSGAVIETKPILVSHKKLVVDEDKTFTLQKNDLVFKGNITVDKLTLLPSEHYKIEGLNIIAPENFSGELIIKLTAEKGALKSDVFSIKLLVTAVNDQPIAVSDKATFIEGSTNNSIDVISNDTDVDNENLTLKSLSYTGGGSAIIKDNKVIYTPKDGFVGTETLSYIVNDGNLDSIAATLTITVTAKQKIVPPKAPKKSSGGAGFYLLLFALCATTRFKKMKI
jgi:hypothetical protein